MQTIYGLPIKHNRMKIAMVIEPRIAIMAAIIAAATVLFELLPYSSWEATMMMTRFHKPNNNSYFLYQEFLEGDIKHTIVVVGIGRGGAPGSSKTGTGVSTTMMDSTSSTSPPAKNKLVHSSFRIEGDVIESLEVAAEKRGMSLSSLVNKILKNYVTSEMYFEELGFILISKNFLRKTFDGLSGEQIAELGKEYGLTIAREYISYFYPQVSSATLIQFLDVWFRRFQSCQHRGDDNNTRRHCYTVNHDININFSLALQSILEGLIEPIIKSTVHFTSITTTSIAFSFEL